VGARLARNHRLLAGDRLRSLTPDQDQLLDFARRYTEAWCSQNPAQVAEHYALEGSLTINGYDRSEYDRQLEQGVEEPV